MGCLCSTTSRGVRVNPTGLTFGPTKTRKFMSNPDTVKVIEDQVILLNNKIMKFEANIKGYDIYTPAIGSGATCTVYLSKKPGHSELYAIKMINREKYKESNFFLDKYQNNFLQREINILKSITHPYIIKLCEAFDEQNDTNAFLIFKYVNGRSITLSKSNDIMPESKLNTYIKQVLLAVDYLHTKCIAHRDIKLENLLHDCDSDSVILSDFGLAIQCNSLGDTCSSIVGTKYYQAPEILMAEKLGEYNPFKADIWALGVVVYRLFYGKLPFKGASNQETNHLVIHSSAAYSEDTSPRLKSFMRHMLKKNPKSRYSSRQLLKHRWITEPLTGIDGSNDESEIETSEVYIVNISGRQSAAKEKPTDSQPTNSQPTNSRPLDSQPDQGQSNSGSPNNSRFEI